MQHRLDPFGPLVALAIALGLVAAYWQEPPPPSGQGDLCRVLAQHPGWYDDARAAETRWDIPAATLFAFVQLESGFRRDARPPADDLFGLIPWRWRSSAYGYGQVQDATWGEYLDARPGFARSRQDMADVLDFVGWYNRTSVRRLGLRPGNARHLWIAYHQGRTGYRRGDWRDDPALRAYADRVAERAAAYQRQLARCAERFACDGLLEIRPFCAPG